MNPDKVGTGGSQRTLLQHITNVGVREHVVSNLIQAKVTSLMQLATPTNITHPTTLRVMHFYYPFPTGFAFCCVRVPYVCTIRKCFQDDNPSNLLSFF